MIHGEHTPSVGNWKLSILAMCNSFAKPRPNASIMENIKCSKPDVGHLKLNVEASFQSEGGAGSTCAMICDSLDNFVATTCTFFPNAPNASMVEACA